MPARSMRHRVEVPVRAGEFGAGSRTAGWGGRYPAQQKGRKSSKSGVGGGAGSR